LQGIQRIDIPYRASGDIPKEYFIISGSSNDAAYFVVIGRTSGGYGIVQKKTICGNPYRHAGGIQIIGSYLVVGVEDNFEKDKSRVCFFDITDPEKPIGDPIIIIQRKGGEKLATAGAVAIAKRAKEHLLIVGSWDSDTLDFYRSNGVELGDCNPKGKSRCRFTYWRTWSKDVACRKGWCDDIWGNYQNLNLVTDVDDRLFLLGYYCNAEEENCVDLYSLDLSKPSSQMIRKENSKRVKCREGAGFKYGGGVYIEDESLLVSYACERNCYDRTVINEFS
jgi:hypothetical protein